MPHQGKRHLSFKILELAKLWPAIGVTGARQIGKTTLLRDLLQIENYVTFKLRHL